MPAKMHFGVIQCNASILRVILISCELRTLALVLLHGEVFFIPSLSFKVASNGPLVMALVSVFGLIGGWEKHLLPNNLGVMPYKASILHLQLIPLGCYSTPKDVQTSAISDTASTLITSM